MPVHADCPDADEMEQLLRGQLPEQRVAEVELHLEDCHGCQTLISDLNVESRLMRTLHETGQPKPADPLPELSDVIDQVIELGSMASIGSCAEESRAEPDDLTFLGPPLAPDELGRLSHYRVLQFLRRGGMGMVFLAEDTRLQRKVALKVMRQRIARNLQSRERFLREAQAMALLKHPNIATIFEVDEIQQSPASADESTAESMPFLAMELLEGQSLAEWLSENNPPPAGWIIEFGKQAAAGLAAAHAQGLIHGDVKPGNLWLEPLPTVQSAKIISGDGQSILTGNRRRAGYVVKLLDFGLVQPHAWDEAGAKVMGTPAYMSPEQLRGEQVGTKSDLFGLGCVLYELCTGRNAFRPNLRQIRSGSVDFVPPKPVRLLNPQVPKKLAVLIHQLLSEEPANRPASAEEVASRMTQIERRLESRRRLRRELPWAAAILAAALLATLCWAVWPVIHNGLFGPRLAMKPASPYPSGPPNESWQQFVAGLPADRQLEAVAAKLRELNPAFELTTLSPRLAGADWMNQPITGLSIPSAHITDLRPLRAFPQLKELHFYAYLEQTGQLSDLSPLKGLPLERLSLSNNPNVTDLSPLRDTALIELSLLGCGLPHLNDVNGTRMELLNISNTPVQDLTPVKRMTKLKTLSCIQCPISSLDPIARLPIQRINIFYNRDRDEKVLKNMPNLQIINGTPVANFWQIHRAS